MAAVWSGALTFGLVSVPVQLYSGPRGRRISLHQLHAVDHERLKQQLVCPRHGRAVTSQEVVRGYEVAPNEYVVLDEDEIRQAAPPTRQQLEILSFCRTEDVDPLWFETAYYLMPDSAGRRPYLLLQQAMEQTGRVGLCRLAMRQRESMAVLRPARLAAEFQPGHGTAPRRHGLLLHTLYYVDEINVADGFGETPESLAATSEESDLARRIVESLTRPFAPENFHDRYRTNLEQLITAHRGGKPLPPRREAPAATPSTDLLRSLQESLEQLQTPGRKPPTPTPITEPGRRRHEEGSTREK